MLCVLLGHAFLVWLLIHELRPQIEAAAVHDAFITELIDIPNGAIEAARLPEPEVDVPLAPPRLSADSFDLAEAPASNAPGVAAERGYVDWPKEGKEAAARVLAREAESERVAKMFAGPQGTWASLTKRQQSELNHFRWRPGIDGLERDERGNTIFTMPNGCALVNFQFIGCPIGKKPPPYGDLFKDMRLYFDEQRRPATQEGNGREPESLRPPKWSKPLGEKDR
jgi:hypothetical protein